LTNNQTSEVGVLELNRAEFFPSEFFLFFKNFGTCGSISFVFVIVSYCAEICSCGFSAPVNCYLALLHHDGDGGTERLTLFLGSRALEGKKSKPVVWYVFQNVDMQLRYCLL